MTLNVYGYLMVATSSLNSQPIFAHEKLYNKTFRISFRTVKAARFIDTIIERKTIVIDLSVNNYWNIEMVRPREFNKQEVLDKILGVFWQLGYDRCSISDLTEATGLKRQSLYNAFGNKSEIFKQALERYIEIVELTLTPLRDLDAGKEELKSYILNTLAEFKKRNMSACFVVKTATENHFNDDNIRSAVEEAGKNVRQCFAELIEREKLRRKLPKDNDTEALAAYIYTVFHGLNALKNTGGNQEQITDIIESTFENLSWK